MFMDIILDNIMTYNVTSYNNNNIAVVVSLRLKILKVMQIKKMFNDMNCKMHICTICKPLNQSIPIEIVQNNGIIYVCYLRPQKIFAYL